VFAGTIDVIIPARNEAETIGPVVDASRGCRYVRDVIVVDDGSTDSTADVAATYGARVVRREPDEGGSKAHAMEAGVDATDADAFLFVDADCLDLTAAHLDEICERLVISDATAKTHVARVLQKLGVRDRVQAVVFAYESGLVTPGAGRLPT